MSFKAMVTAGVVVGALVMPGSALAAPEDFVSGSGTFEFGPSLFFDANFTAHGTPADAHGQVNFGDVKGKVTCVFVEGNEATVSSELTRPIDSNTHFILFLKDNGQPSGDTPDEAAAGGAPFPIDCAFIQFGPMPPIVQGNVVVKDNTP